MADKAKTLTERTRVVTVDITIIEKLEPGDKSLRMGKEETKKLVAEEIKAKLDADDVQIVRLKDFVMTKQPG